MLVILSQNLLIDDPSKDSYYFDFDAAVAPEVIVDVGAHLFDGQKITVLFKQNATGTGTLSFGATVVFISGHSPTLPLVAGARVLVRGMVVAGMLYATTSDVSFLVSKAGDTMTGALTLSADPSQALEAATKQYVDAHAGGAVTYHPLTGHRYGSVAASVGAFMAHSAQPWGLTTRMSVTEYKNTPVFRLNTPLSYDMYAGPTSAPNALGYTLYVSEATQGDAWTPPVAYAVFKETQYTASVFVNPFCAEVQNNPVGAGIPVGIHASLTDNNLVSIQQSVSTPPAWIHRFDDPNVTLTAPVGLVSGNNYAVTLELTNSTNAGIQWLNTNNGLDPGSGYLTPGTYTNVALTNVSSTGVGATANITVSAGTVTNVTIVTPGSGYSPDDQLSAAATDIGGRTGGYDFTIRVGTTLPVTIPLSIAGADVTTFESLVQALNVALSATNVMCAWSFGNAIVFVLGQDTSSQTASYLRITDELTPGSLFDAIATTYNQGWTSTDVPATGPQAVEMTKSNYDGTAADLLWNIPLEPSTALNG